MRIVDDKIGKARLSAVALMEFVPSESPGTTNQDHPAATAVTPRI